MIFCPTIDGSDFWASEIAEKTEIRAQNFPMIVGQRGARRPLALLFTANQLFAHSDPVSAVHRIIRYHTCAVAVQLPACCRVALVQLHMS